MSAALIAQRSSEENGSENGSSSAASSASARWRSMAVGAHRGGAHHRQQRKHRRLRRRRSIIAGTKIMAASAAQPRRRSAAASSLAAAAQRPRRSYHRISGAAAAALGVSYRSNGGGSGTRRQHRLAHQRAASGIFGSGWRRHRAHQLSGLGGASLGGIIMRRWRKAAQHSASAARIGARRPLGVIASRHHAARNLLSGLIALIARHRGVAGGMSASRPRRQRNNVGIGGGVAVGASAARRSARGAQHQ